MPRRVTRHLIEPSRHDGEPELWGAAECADYLGVKQPNLHTLAGLPAPYDRIRATTLWRADDIRAFRRRRRANARAPRAGRRMSLHPRGLEWSARSSPLPDAPGSRSQARASTVVSKG